MFLSVTQDFEESNLMHSMNGFIYGTLPGLDMLEGDKVRWHVAAYGTEVRRRVADAPPASESRFCFFV